MKILALLPFFLTIMVLISKGEKEAFKVVLFCLFCIPSYYYFPLPALPDFNFFHFSIIPIFVWWLLYGIKEYRYSTMDILVVLYVLVSIASEFHTMGFKDGRNLFIDRIVQIIIPYIIAKHFLRTFEDKVKFAKFLVISGAVLAFFSPLEFKFDFALVDFLQFVWPEYLRWPGWARYGFVRAAAVYAHPILAGMMWAFYSLLALWLYKIKAFKNKYIIYGLICLNIGGLLMSISKGPILGFVVGVTILTIGWTKKRLLAFNIVFILSAILLPPATSKFIEYASVNRFNAKNETQENIAYRKELIDNYIVEVKKKPYLGYGRNGMPVVNGQVSIDNQYLYIALLHGTLALYIFLAMTIVVVIKMLKFGLHTSYDDKEGQLSWLILACSFTWFVTLATVWMGAQSEQIIIFFLALNAQMKLEDNKTYVIEEVKVIERKTFKRTI